MATRTPISGSVDLVTYTVKVNGSEIPGDVQILNMSIDKAVNRIPTAQIIIADGDAAAQEFKMSNEDFFIPGNEIEIALGYHSDNTTVYKGLIIKQQIKIPQGRRSSVLVVECKDIAFKSTIGRKSKYFYESKDNDIIEEIFRNYQGLTTNVDTTSLEHAELVQYRMTDWDFVQTRAEINGLICLVSDGVVDIKKPDFGQSPIYSLAYGESIISLDAEIDARNQFAAVQAQAWNAGDQAIVDVDANDPGVEEVGNLSAASLADVSGLDTFELRHGGKAEEQELQAWADAQLLRSRMSKVQGTVTCQGAADVLPGKIIELTGVSDRFNGKVYVSAIRHELTAGFWKTIIQFGFNPEWFTETYEVSELPASGLLGAVNGLQTGVVTQLQDDPDGNDRILVRLPIIDQEEQGVWARVASLDAGENRGAFFRPEVGDEVIVGFINDDPRDAIVLGMLNSSNKPAPITASDDNHEKGFVTRSEMKLLFNDDKRDILIETPAGNSILISDDESTITVTDQNNNKIVMDSDGVTIESAKDVNIKANGDINLEGVNINAKANAQFKAEGAAGAEVSSSAVAVLKGSLVQIN